MGEGCYRKQDVHAACWGHEVKVPSCPKRLSQPCCPYQRQHMHGMWDFGNNPLHQACTPLGLRLTYHHQRTTQAQCSSHPLLEKGTCWWGPGHLNRLLVGSSLVASIARPSGPIYQETASHCREATLPASPTPSPAMPEHLPFVHTERIPREEKEPSSEFPGTLSPTCSPGGSFHRAEASNTPGGKEGVV